MLSIQVGGVTVNLDSSSLVDPDGEPLGAIDTVRELDKDSKQRLIRGTLKDR